MLSAIDSVFDAHPERVVFDGPDRIKNVGVRRRIFAGATRRAVELRDRSCFHPTCDVAAENCVINHWRSTTCSRGRRVG